MPLVVNGESRGLHLNGEADRIGINLGEYAGHRDVVEASARTCGLDKDVACPFGELNYGPTLYDECCIAYE